MWCQESSRCTSRVSLTLQQLHCFDPVGGGTPTVYDKVRDWIKSLKVPMTWKIIAAYLTGFSIIFHVIGTLRRPVWIWLMTSFMRPLKDTTKNSDVSSWTPYLKVRPESLFNLYPWMRQQTFSYLSHVPGFDFLTPHCSTLVIPWNEPWCNIVALR